MKGAFARLSRRQRRGTPRAFAAYLIYRVLLRHRADRVAVLWTMPRSVYWDWFPAVEVWGQDKDANTYHGPHPVIAHPPCGPWGKCRAFSKERIADARHAMEIVHKWGGVVEHPVGSSLFRTHGRDGQVERVNQGDFGHYTPKPTLLYWHPGEVGRISVAP